MRGMNILRRGVLAAVAGCMALAGVSHGQMNAYLPNPGPMQWVNPVDGVNIPGPFVIGDDEHLRDVLDMPPFDQIPPMPMPNSDNWQPSLNPDWSTTFHDAETGETYQMPLNPNLSGQGFGQSPWGDYKGADQMTEDEWAYRGFGSMFAIGGDLTTWPRRGNVKLFMRFVDQNNITRWFTCSGSMTDAGVVLTAAHCVYARNPNGINIFNWASEVIVYPAWNGVGTEWGVPGSTEVIQNFGWARGTAYLAGTNYINNGDFDSDAGLVRIQRNTSRHTGAMTGWFAWAWGGSCGFHQGQLYQSYSYPSENCGGGLHTGRTLYYWSGNWDSCPGNQLQMDTTAGCLTAVWGGMSGSGAYYADGDNRYVHAICSNSNRSTIGRYARQWEQWINDRNTFVTNTRGSTFDLQALQFRATGSTTVKAGTAMNAGSTVLMCNTTNANPASATYTLRVYLSTNNIISGSDTLLATWNYSVDFGAMQNITFSVPAPTIPVTTTPGTYWIGVVLDAATDSFSSNNATSTWDAQQISVTLGDPAAPVLSSPSNGATNVSINADLFWGSAARATSYDVYFGTSGTPPFIGNTASTSWNLPVLSHDTLYFWRVVSRNAAGTASSPTWSFRTQAAPFVDLSANYVTTAAGTFYRGTNILVNHQVGNIGNATSNNYTLEIRISPNTIISTADPLMSSTNYIGLNAGSTRTINSFASQIPPTMSPGTYYIGTRIVSGEDTNSANNTAVTGNTITVAACSGDFTVPWGVIDFFDIQTFLNWYSANDPRANLNGDNFIDFFDVQMMLNWYSQGCP